VNANGKRLLTPEEVAEQLRVGRTKVYALFSSGKLRSVKIGRTRRVSQAAVDEFVQKSEAGEADL
jgi:excisionase family DNA binding protein